MIGISKASFLVAVPIGIASAGFVLPGPIGIYQPAAVVAGAGQFDFSDSANSGLLALLSEDF